MANTGNLGNRRRPLPPRADYFSGTDPLQILAPMDIIDRQRCQGSLRDSRGIRQMVALA